MTTSNREMRRLSKADVLNLSGLEKKKYFHLVQVRHTKLGTAADELMELLSPYSDTKIVVVAGATGVGKTALVQHLIRAQFEEPDETAGQSASAIPFISINVPANGDKSLSWATIYSSILAEAHEVLIERKEACQIENGRLLHPHRRNVTLAALRESLDSMLRYRRVRVLAMDEVFPLLQVGQFEAVMDTLKSLVISNDAKLILLGSYNVYDLISSRAEGIRRAELVHFARYDGKIARDKRDFADIVGKLERAWPCADVPNFHAITDELLIVSLGCVGLLKMLMQNALSLQIKNKEKWDPSFLAKSAKSMRFLGVIRKEIEIGEEKIKEASYGESYFSEEKLKELSPRIGR